jgi:hypothetical protein
VSDRTLRAAERDAASGDPEAEAQLARARQRAGLDSSAASAAVGRAWALAQAQAIQVGIAAGARAARRGLWAALARAGIRPTGRAYSAARVAAERAACERVGAMTCRDATELAGFRVGTDPDASLRAALAARREREEAAS